MTESLSDGARRVQEALQAAGFKHRVSVMQRSARTAEEAALAVGCAVGQIAKSLVFRGVRTGEPVLVVASGPNRVDETRVAALLGEPVEKPDAAFVRAVTGYVIGGVPPLGHAQRLRTLLDRDLLCYETIWAAAGHPKAVFQLAPRELEVMTGGGFAEVATGA